MSRKNFASEFKQVENSLLTNQSQEIQGTQSVELSWLTKLTKSSLYILGQTAKSNVNKIQSWLRQDSDEDNLVSTSWNQTLTTEVQTFKYAVDYAIDNPIKALTIGLASQAMLAQSQLISFTNAGGLVDNNGNRIACGTSYGGSALGDLSGDGFVDFLCVGGPSGAFKYYINNGAEIFNIQTTPSGLVVSGSSPTQGDVPIIADFNDDGKFDIVVGHYSSTTALRRLSYFINTGTETNPTFALQTNNPASNPFYNFTYGTASVPGLYVSGGLNNIAVGDASSNAPVYLQNIGTRTNPIFAKQTGTDNIFDLGGAWNSNTFKAISTSSFTTSSGDTATLAFETFSGTTVRTALLDNNNGRFTDVTGTANDPFNGVTIGTSGYLRSTIGDVDNDGRPDIVFQDNGGNVYYFKNTTPLVSTSSSSSDQPSSTSTTSSMSSSSSDQPSSTSTTSSMSSSSSDQPSSDQPSSTSTTSSMSSSSSDQPSSDQPSSTSTTSSMSSSSSDQPSSTSTTSSTSSSSSDQPSSTSTSSSMSSSSSDQPSSTSTTSSMSSSSSDQPSSTSTTSSTSSSSSDQPSSTSTTSSMSSSSSDQPSSTSTTSSMSSSSSDQPSSTSTTSSMSSSSSDQPSSTSTTSSMSSSSSDQPSSTGTTSSMSSSSSDQPSSTSTTSSTSSSSSDQPSSTSTTSSMSSSLSDQPSSTSITSSSTIISSMDQSTISKILTSLSIHDPQADESSPDNHNAAIVGGTIGGFAGLALATLGVIGCVKYYRDNSEAYDVQDVELN